jgi:hypothetical protein
LAVDGSKEMARVDLKKWLFELGCKGVLSFLNLREQVPFASVATCCTATATAATVCVCRHLLRSHRHRRRRDTLCPLPPHRLQGMTTHAFFESPCCMDHACACDTHGHRASSVRAQGSLEVHKTVQFVSTPFSSYETRIQGASPGSPRGP